MEDADIYELVAIIHDRGGFNNLMQQMLNFIFVELWKKLRRRLTLNERIVIETLLKENKTKSYIAKYLNRNRSTNTREVSTWVRVPSDNYEASIANFFAKEEYQNKKNKDKINT